MKKAIVFLLLSLVISNASSQNAAEVDTSFNTEGWFGVAGTVNKIAHTINGKIMVGGTISFYRGTRVNNIFRLNMDGTLDTSFNPGALFSSEVKTFALQTDGKIIVCGNAIGAYKIKRLNPDGSVDTTFNVSENYRANVLTVQTDGKVLAGGDSPNGTFLDQLIRFNTNGTLDTSFDSNIIGTVVNEIIVEPTGKIMVAGDGFSNANYSGVLRLNANGSIDGTFTLPFFYSQIRTLSKQADGKFILGGSFNYENEQYNVARINSDGSIDTSFNFGQDNLLGVYASTVREDGKILIGGRFTQYNQTEANSIVCLNTDGTIDDTFDSGMGFNHKVYALEAHTGNSFFAGGDFTYYDIYDSDSILLIDSDANIEAGFGIGKVTNTQTAVSTVCELNDGRILAGGIFNHYNNVNLNRLTCFNSDGSEDVSFNIGTGFTNGIDYASVKTIAQQTDGKILIGGNFKKFNGTDLINLVRLNSDGSLDPSFSNGNPEDLSYSVQKILVQPDGKILVIGSGSASWNSGKVVRLNPDGSLDTSFQIPILNAQAEATALQTDGKIIIGGRFSTCNTFQAKGIVRLNIDGTIDNSFLTGSGFDTTGASYVRSLAIQPDGKILVGGWFRAYDVTTTVRYIVRLNPDGMLDSSFNFGTGFNSGTSSLALDNNNKILVGGSFSSYNGTPANRIIRLNTDGTSDLTFNSGSGFVDSPNVSVLSSGKTMAYGGFSTYNGLEAKQVIRLLGNEILATEDPTPQNRVALSFNVIKDLVYFTSDNTVVLKSYSIFDLSGKEVKTGTITDKKINIVELEKGCYILKAETSLGTFTDRLIKK